MNHGKFFVIMVLAVLVISCSTQSPEPSITPETPKDSTPSEVTTNQPSETSIIPIVPTIEQPLTMPVSPEINITTEYHPSLIDVSVCLCWRTQSQFAGFYAAFDKGFYREQGLNVTIISGGPEVRPFEVVKENRANFGVGQAQEVLQSYDRAIPIQCIATLFQTGALKLVSKKTLGITSPEKLRGKTISLWMNGYEYQCLALLEKYSISREDDVKIIQQGFEMDDFIDNKVQVASVMTYNELMTLYERGIKEKDLTILSYSDYGLNFPEDSIFAQENYIKSNPEIVEKFLNASLKGWQWAMENPQETVNIMLRQDSKLTREHETNMLREVLKLMVNDNTKKNGLGYISTQDWLDMSKILYQQNVIKKRPNLSYILNQNFIQKMKYLPPATPAKF